MAYSFDGSTQYLEKTAPTITDWPMTMHVTGKSSDNTSNQVLFTFQQLNNPWNGFLSDFLGAIAGDYVACTSFGLGGVLSTVSYADGGWHRVTHRRSSDTSATLFVDGVDTACPSTTVDFPTGTFAPGVLYVAHRFVPSADMKLNGDVACLAMWNVYLDDGECKSLSAGFSPQRIRPQSLLLYAPLLRTIATRGHTGTAFTAYSSPTASDHPATLGL